MRKRKYITLSSRSALSGYLFILPWIIGFVLFFVFNFLSSFRYSFSEVILKPEGGISMKFTGFSNYIDIFRTHATYNRTLTESMISLLVDVPLIIFFSLFIAVLLNRKFVGRALVRAVFLLPVILATDAVTMALSESLKTMMGGITNLPDEMTATAGLNVSYVVNTFADFGVPVRLIEYIMSTVSRIYDVIRSSGVQILIFLASLQSIPRSLYEVAQIEGATAYETFWKITFPMVSPFILTNVVYTIVDAYTKSEVVRMAYTTAFSQFNFGVSAAMSMVSTAITCLILSLLGTIISRYIFYQN